MGSDPKPPCRDCYDAFHSSWRGGALLTGHFDCLDSLFGVWGKTANELKAMLRKHGVCPYGRHEPGEPMAKCKSGFPGCSCDDDIEAWAEEAG